MIAVLKNRFMLTKNKKSTSSTYTKGPLYKSGPLCLKALTCVKLV